jgi:hypothetical protein
MTAIQLFVLLAAIFSAAGWILSSIGQLNATGYSVVIALFALGLFIWNKMRFRISPVSTTGAWRKWRRRFTRPLPLCFLLIALLILLGGILYAPNNYDALSYRIPRVLNWLAENRWHWIHTQDGRMNTRITGSEWLMAPFLALTKTDRAVFLINFACFILLPGLVFSTFSRLGVNRRVAWNWMWLAPSGYTFILGAGGNANDILGVLYAIAGMHFALRAAQLRRFSDFCFAILAGALLTNSKSSNLPLLLPIGVALLPALRLTLRRPLAATGVVLMAALISTIPNAWINTKKTGDWTGYSVDSVGFNSALLAKYENPSANAAPQTLVLMIKDPLIGIAGNAAILTVENFVPPIFPKARAWNAFVDKKAPEIFGPKLHDNFLRGFLKLRELQGEETAGIGFGLSWLLLISLVAAAILSKHQTDADANVSSSVYKWMLVYSPWISLFVYMVKSSVTAGSRIIAPYYFFIIPSFLLCSGHKLLIRKRWWQRAAIAVYAVAFIALVVEAERPLWPAKTILNKLAQHTGNSSIARAKTVYDVYANRNDVFKPIRSLLPPDARDLGFLCVSDEPPTSLWRPFGSRRVRQLLLDDSRESLNKWNVKYVIARDFGAALDQWLARVNGERVACKNILLYATQPPIPWCVIRLK